MTDQFSLFDLDEDLRPAYSVPSMAEIRALPKNGLTAVGTFSGSGGSSLGLQMAGFTVPVALEFTPQGAATYRANNPSTTVIERDVREVTGEEILELIGLRPGELDLFEGSPPCSSFSGAGVRAGSQYEDRVGKVKSYSEGISQRTDDLFEEWVRLVATIRPKAVIAENVPEMARPGSAQDYLHMIMHQLKELGYDCNARVYSSLNAGCATMRKRLVLMGVRKDVGSAPIVKLTGSGYTLRQGLETLPVEIPADEWGEAWFDGTGTNAETGEPLPRYQIADHWACLLPGQGHDPWLCKGGPDGKKPHLFSLIKADWDKPLYTVTASGAGRGGANVTHPDEPRKFTATELKWLSGFPADYVLTGTPLNRYERIGRAVTPPLYGALGKHMARAIKGGA